MAIKRMNQSKIVDPARFTAANWAFENFLAGGDFPPDCEYRCGGWWNRGRGDDSASTDIQATCRVTGRIAQYDIKGMGASARIIHRKEVKRLCL